MVNRMNYYISNRYPDELYHYGVKGMKWGVRKHDYRSHSISGMIARRQNDKIDKSFKKWQKGANNKESAINAGKKANESRLAYETDKRNKDKKAQYKADKKAYKKELRKNTTYRKGSVREEVGKDMSRKYMSAAKSAKKSGDMKSYGKLMTKHDVERARARKAQSVGAARSSRKAAFKRGLTMAAKATAASAITYAGVQYARKKGVNISIADINNLSSYANMAKRAMSYMY